MDDLSDLLRSLGHSLELEELHPSLDLGLRRLIACDAIWVHTVEKAPPAHERLPIVMQLSDSTAAPEGRSGTILIFPIKKTVTLVIYRRGEVDFSDDDLDVLRTLGPNLGTSIEIVREYREARPEAGSLFQHLDAELARSQRCQNVLAVLNCTIECFDQFGKLCSKVITHVAFEEVALRLREKCREYDFTTQSGDELVLVLPGLRPSSLPEKRESIERIVAEVGAEAGLPIFVAVGAAFFPEDGNDAEDLLAAAAHNVTLARMLAFELASGYTM